jgi:hypothetical protein
VCIEHVLLRRRLLQKVEEGDVPARMRRRLIVNIVVVVLWVGDYGLPQVLHALLSVASFCPHHVESTAAETTSVGVHYRRQLIAACY